MEKQNRLAAVLAAGQQRPDPPRTFKIISWDLMPQLPKEVVPFKREITRQIEQAYNAYRRNENGVLAKGHIKILFDLPPPAGFMEIRVYGDSSNMKINWISKQPLPPMPSDARYIEERLRVYFITLSNEEQRKVWSHWTLQRAKFRWAYYSDETTRVLTQWGVVSEMPPPPPKAPAKPPKTSDEARREAEAAASLLGMHGNRPTGARSRGQTLRVSAAYGLLRGSHSCV